MLRAPRQGLVVVSIFHAHCLSRPEQVILSRQLLALTCRRVRSEAVVGGPAPACLPSWDHTRHQNGVIHNTPFSVRDAESWHELMLRALVLHTVVHRRNQHLQMSVWKFP